MSQTLTPVRASLALLRAAYPNAIINPETITAYEEALADVDAQDVMDAVADLVKESKFFPTIAEIREGIAEHKLGLPSGTAAWSEAQKRSFGTWDGPRHPLVHEAIQAMGGTYSIKTSENPSIMQAQFLKAYKEMRADAIQQFVRTGCGPVLRALPQPIVLHELPSGEFEVNLKEIA